MATKNAKPSGRATGRKAKTATAPAPEWVPGMVPHDRIDPTPAEQVRDGFNREALERYEAAFRAGEILPPADVFAGPTGYYLGDGGHRFQASLAAERDALSCRIKTFGTDEEARRAAILHAAGANEEHGLYRTADDKRAAVSVVLRMPEHEETSDNEVGRVCKVSHILVRLVREKLTHEGLLEGKARSTERGYNPDAKLRGNMVSDGRGNLVDPRPEPEPEPESSPPVGGADEGEAEPVARPEEEAAEESPPVDPYRTERYRDCPLVTDGRHPQTSGVCKVCQGKGWVTRHEWDTLTVELKTLGDRQAKRERQVSATGDPVKAAVLKVLTEAQASLSRLGDLSDSLLRSAAGDRFREAAERVGLPFAVREEEERPAVPPADAAPGQTAVTHRVEWWPALAQLQDVFLSLAADRHRSE